MRNFASCEWDPETQLLTYTLPDEPERYYVEYCAEDPHINLTCADVPQKHTHIKISYPNVLTKLSDRVYELQCDSSLVELEGVCSQLICIYLFYLGGGAALGVASVDYEMELVDHEIIYYGTNEEDAEQFFGNYAHNYSCSPIFSSDDIGLLGDLADLPALEECE